MKNAYLAEMREKTREETKLDSYIRDQSLFSGRVVVRMEELGLQATDLVKPSGVSITAVGYILRGETKYPRPETLFGLADFLGVEARWLGIGEGQKERANSHTIKHISAARGSVRAKAAPADGRKEKSRTAG